MSGYPVVHIVAARPVVCSLANSVYGRVDLRSSAPSLCLYRTPQGSMRCHPESCSVTRFLRGEDDENGALRWWNWLIMKYWKIWAKREITANKSIITDLFRGTLDKLYLIVLFVIFALKRIKRCC